MIAALTGGLPGMLAFIVPALPFAGLIFAAAYNETIEFRQQTDRIRLYINQLQIQRLDRNWSKIPETDPEVPDEFFHLSKDLDLFGKASLFKLVNIASTPLGIRNLADWLMKPGTPEQIKLRQESVEVLKPATELREKLQLLSHSVAIAQTNPGDLLQWSRGELWLDKHPLLYRLTVISSLAVLICPILFFATGLKVLFGSLLLGLLAFHILISIIYAGSIHKIFNSVGYRQRDVANYVELFHLAKDLPSDSKMLGDIRHILFSGDQNAVATARKLQSIIGVAQMRRSGLLFLVYIVFQFLFVIDIHTLKWLESWHRKHADQVGDWLNAIATWEALSSLSNLAYNQPRWQFPTVDPKADQIDAQQLGHPLIGDDDRVCNDVEVGPKDSILLVTGSNMSGKSTLLRSIGLNCTLAQAGSVVCADKLVLPPLQIETSMRIGDSISEGVSFFMAELNRLREVTVEAEKLANIPERTLLYLLDEILQGTNSRERQIAVISVCEHLLESGAIGAISTHDLELADAKTLKEKCQTVHFREFFKTGENGKQEMGFDYVMRDGVSPTTNALKLLEMVGLTYREPTQS